MKIITFMHIEVLNKMNGHYFSEYFHLKTKIFSFLLIFSLFLKNGDN